MIPSLRPSIHPSVRPFVHSSVRPSIRPFVHSSVRPSIHPSVRPFVHSSVRPSIRSFVRPSVRPSIRPSVHSSVPRTCVTVDHSTPPRPPGGEVTGHRNIDRRYCGVKPPMVISPKTRRRSAFVLHSRDENTIHDSCETQLIELYCSLQNRVDTLKSVFLNEYFF